MTAKTTDKAKKQELSNIAVSKRDNHPFEQGQYNPVKSEMALWTAVITQALMDAGSESSKPEAQHEKAKAIRWLLGNSEDFITVCQNAGLDPQSIRQKAMSAIERGCVWRRGMTEKRQLPEKPEAPLPMQKKYHIPARLRRLGKHPTSPAASSGFAPFPLPAIKPGPNYIANRY